MPLAPPVTTTTRGRACPPAAAAAAAWPHDRKATAARSMATPVVATLVRGCCTSTPENAALMSKARFGQIDFQAEHPSKKVQTLAREKIKITKMALLQVALALLCVLSPLVDGGGCTTDADCTDAGFWKCCGVSEKAENCPMPHAGVSSVD
jgi:hypothetical protein